jgi:hypothetical protein
MSLVRSPFTTQGVVQSVQAALRLPDVIRHSSSAATSYQTAVCGSSLGIGGDREGCHGSGVA